MGVRALAKAMAVPPLSRGHASVRSQAERARAGRSPAGALPSSPHPLPPLRAPLGGRSRDDSAKRARHLLRKRSGRAEPLASEKMKLFPKNYTSWAIFWCKKPGETCPSRRVRGADTSTAWSAPAKCRFFNPKKSPIIILLIEYNRPDVLTATGVDCPDLVFSVFMKEYVASRFLDLRTNPMIYYPSF